MNLQMQNLTDTYNNLPDVEWADEKLNSLEKSKILETLSGVIIKHKLEYLIGIRLLHNHNSIDNSELMIEKEEIIDNSYCLTTLASKKEDNIQNVVSNSWKLCDGNFEPLEFSIDSMVIREFDIMISKSQFFKEFGNCLQDLGVDNILGPCIIRREFFGNRRTSDSALLVETSDQSRRANILRFENPEKYDTNSLIQTTWLAVNITDGDEANCTANCAKAACVPHTACVKDGQGGHSQQSHHSSSHTRTHSPS
jgi:hypothetical protein